MRFVKAKKDNIKCSCCESYINRDEEMVLVFLRYRTYSRLMPFHVKCYPEWWLAHYNRRWAEWHHGSGNFNRPKLGRPVLHLTPTREQNIHRLRARKSYYKKLGDMDMVGVIQAKIDKVKKSHSDNIVIQ